MNGEQHSPLPGRDPEGAWVRLGVGMVITIALMVAIEEAWIGLTLTSFSLFFAYFYLYAIGYLAYLQFRRPSFASRIVTNIFDTFSTTVAIYVSGGPHSPLMLVYFWLVIANSARFGRRFLILATVNVLIAYHLLVLWAGYWEEYTFEVITQSFFYLLLPLYINMLLSQLQRAKSAAEASERAKSGFLANMTHELRTPLVGVVNMVELIKRTELTKEQAGYVATQERSAQLLMALINDVLDFSKIEANHLQIEAHPFHLKQTLDEVVDILRPIAEKKGIELINQLQLDHGETMVGDERRLKQILLNLLGNAVKYTQHGAISLRVVVRTAVDGIHQVRIDITDTGPGLTEEQRETVFESFWQGDNSEAKSYGGVGLGTAIVKALVEAMGGRLGVQSMPTRGSNFWVELPFQQASDDELIEAPDAEPVERRSLKLLLVEDDEIARFAQQRLLEQLGHRVAVANDGFQALELQGEPFDLVLMDMRMPGMDGLETTRRWRKREAEEGGGHTPIIAVSANTGEEERQRCREAGMDDYISKPVSPDRLERLMFDYAHPLE